MIDDYAYDQMTALARRVAQPGVGGACIVFVNSDAGEGYITVDNNEGDRNNLTQVLSSVRFETPADLGFSLWHNGDTIIQTVAAECPNTIVVMHTVGPVLVDAWYEHENVSFPF